MGARVKTKLVSVRRSRGTGAAELARRVGVSRQTIYAIEAGTYVPNTEVALRLAHALEVGVEDLFSLPVESRDSGSSLSAEVLSEARTAPGQAVRLSRIGRKWVGVPVTAIPYFLPEADGVITRPARTTSKADVLVFSQEEPFQRRLVIAGCDPATRLVARMVERIAAVEIVTAAASSRRALDWLKQGKVHIAGSHLEDPQTGEFNLLFVRRRFLQEEVTVVTLAGWEEGLVVRTGNPKSLRSVEDLARKDVVFVNRETGSGSRALLERMLQGAGIAAANVRGYDHVARGHLAAAYSVLSGAADCCLAARSAATAFGLDFVPFLEERYDLVFRKETLELPAAQAFLDVLQRGALRRKLQTLAGYDTSQTGQVHS